MKVYIIERDFDKYKYLPLYFKDTEDVILINDSFENFIKTNKVDCVVSPANSFGLMDGGYDLALTEWYGEQLQKRVQQYIIDNYYGEQPIGTSFIIETNKDNQFLIHTPTMRAPSKIKDDTIIYQCMRTTLMLAKQHNINSILIPMFEGLTGGIRPQRVVELMKLAYDQILNPKEITYWENIDKIKLQY